MSAHIAAQTYCWVVVVLPLVVLFAPPLPCSVSALRPTRGYCSRIVSSVPGPLYDCYCLRVLPHLRHALLDPDVP